MSTQNLNPRLVVPGPIPVLADIMVRGTGMWWKKHLGSLGLICEMREMDHAFPQAPSDSEHLQFPRMALCLGLSTAMVQETDVWLVCIITTLAPFHTNLLMSCTPLSFPYSKDHLTPQLVTLHGALLVKGVVREQLSRWFFCTEGMSSSGKHTASILVLGLGGCNQASANSRKNVI
jgi:hypothetical protein